MHIFTLFLLHFGRRWVWRFFVFSMIPPLCAPYTGTALYTGSGRAGRNGLGKGKKAAPPRLHPKSHSRGSLEDHFIEHEQFWVRKKAAKNRDDDYLVDLKVVV